MAADPAKHIIIKVEGSDGVKAFYKAERSAAAVLNSLSIKLKSNGTLRSEGGPDVAGDEDKLEAGFYVYTLLQDTEPSTSGPSAALTRDQVATLIQKKLPAPSSYAKNTPTSGWSDTRLAELLPYIDMHRPALRPASESPSLPVSLQDPILASIEEDCKYSSPTKADAVAARELIMLMSGSFLNEDARVDAFSSFARKYLHLHLDRMSFRQSLSDGTALIPTALFTALGANVEVKLDIGSGGGDPHIQNPAYLVLGYSDEARTTVRQISRCPAILLQLAGPHLSVSGFTWGEKLCADQLSQTVCLLWQPRSELLISVARLVRAIRRGWPILQNWYMDLGADYARWSSLSPAEQELSNQPLPTAYPGFFSNNLSDLQLAFPYPRSYGSPAAGFVYEKRLSSLTFLAKCTDGTPVVIKYCKRYSAEAHKILEAAGYAPAILSHKVLPGRWHMVVMDFMEGSSTWDEVTNKPVVKLRTAVDLLHEADFVHGDLRPPNVLVDKEKIHIIDYEWAGPAGEVQYPIFMNHQEIVWPDGASDGKPIVKAHDEWWLDKLCAPVGTTGRRRIRRESPTTPSIRPRPRPRSRPRPPRTPPRTSPPPTQNLWRLPAPQLSPEAKEAPPLRAPLCSRVKSSLFGLKPRFFELRQMHAPALGLQELELSKVALSSQRSVAGSRVWAG